MPSGSVADGINQRNHEDNPEQAPQQGPHHSPEHNPELEVIPSGLIPHKDFPWQDLSYIGPYDEQLVCPICRGPFVNPVTIGCAHTFCGQCLDEHEEFGGDTCPIDRRPIVQEYPSALIIRNQLSSLTVECPNARCNHVCTRSNIEVHYSRDCKFTLVSCPDSNCKKFIARDDAKTDPPECSHQETACEFCGKQVDLATVEEHNRACDHQDVDCEFCHETMTNIQLNDHLLVCTERPMPCSFRDFGCPFRVKLVDFGEHKVLCPFKLAYIANLRFSSARDEMMRRSEAQIGELLTERIAALETTMQSEITDLKSQLSAMRIDLTRASTRIATLEAGPAPNSYSYHSVVGHMGPGMNQFHPVGLAGQPSPGQPSAHPDGPHEMDRVEEIIDNSLARIMTLERDIAEINTRHEAENRAMGNEMGVTRQQIGEVRNVTAQLSMQVRWLLDTVREAKRATTAMSNTGLAFRGGGTSAGVSRNESQDNSTRRTSEEAPRL